MESPSSSSDGPPTGVTVFRNTLLHPMSMLIVGLALSIGWGIRGNYGHETGAMFPGAVAAIAACLLSGRPDWHCRVVYFGLFGMLGWAFGGSISYMMVIGYTQSGHSSTQLFGFVGLFVIGFLWASLGGAGTALPAALSDKQLKSLFIPLTVLFATWLVMFYALDPLNDAIQHWVELGGVESSMRRQERALYWLDSDWFQVSLILIVLLVYDLVMRRFENGWWLLAFAAVGGLISFVVVFAIAKTAGADSIAGLLVQHQGMFEDRFQPEQLAVTNWPRLLLYLGQGGGLLYGGDSLALWGGALFGVAVYFIRFGRFDFGSGLFASMAVGWLVAFILLPVIGSLFLPQFGGLRMTPPRGDNWAGILGALVGAMIFCWRSQLRSIVVAALLCGTLGGMAFSGAAWCEGMLVSLGNRNLTVDPQLWTAWQQTAWQPESWTSGQRMPRPEFIAAAQTPEAWIAWQNQNWHSFLEQSYGFFNGLAIAITMAVLATRVPRHSTTQPGSSWMLLLALVVVFPVLAYLNLYKNLGPWTQDFGGHQSMPLQIAVPWTQVELSLRVWFDLFWLLGTLAMVGLYFAHRRRPIAMLSSSWIGRGQLLFLAVLWTFVAGNFTRALPSFGSGRMLTEGIIYVNAVLVSVLLLIAPVLSRASTLRENVNWFRVTGTVACLFVIVALAAPGLQWWSMRRVYQDAHSGKRGMDFRFGPNANWKRAPLVKGELHR